jgi:hypothetical protein
MDIFYSVGNIDNSIWVRDEGVCFGTLVSGAGSEDYEPNFIAAMDLLLRHSCTVGNSMEHGVRH